MTDKGRVHFVGIGGVGMSGLAEILLASGYSVSGSDVKANRYTERLAGLGANIHIGHRANQVHGSKTVVFSSAIDSENVELKEAAKEKITILARADMLAELMRKKQSIVVAGSHGKTTTSAMIATLLMEAGCDPTAVIGGSLKKIASNARMGTDEWFVCESDESDGSFLKLLPTIGVITNIDSEHLDHYGSFGKLEKAFEDFANRVPFDGVTVICSDDHHCNQLLSKVEKPVLLYGIKQAANVVAKDVELLPDLVRFSLLKDLKSVCTVAIPTTGKHNVLNALAAAAVGLQTGLSGKEIKRGLEAFGGIERRLELKGEVNGVRLIDDYAHHPTEIKATLDSLRFMANGGALRLLVQPHRFSRLRNHWDEFVNVFDGVEELILAPVYRASEEEIPGIDSQNLMQAIHDRGRTNVRCAENLEAAAEMLVENVQSGDLLATLGAGDITYCAPQILEGLRRVKGD